MKNDNIAYHKYTHILWQNELKFSTNIVKAMSENHPTIESQEHHFVTLYYEVFDALKEYGNISYYKTDNSQSSEIINEVGRYTDWIFMHNICTDIELLKVKPKYIKKIIWRSWGGGRLTGIPYGNNKIKNIAKYFVNKEVKRRVKQFKIIGVANIVDEIELSDCFGQLNYMEEPYSLNSSIDTLSTILPKESDSINIIIGHSGYSEDNHISIANSLEKFKDKNLKLYFPFSYGNKKYIDETKAYLAEHWGDKAVFINDFMEYKDYAALLASMDIAFLDAPYSYALGNITILTYFNKKIFLRENGILARSFDKCNAPYSLTKSIDNMTFDEFIHPSVYEGETWKALTAVSSDMNLKYWERIINYINN